MVHKTVLLCAACAGVGGSGGATPPGLGKPVTAGLYDQSGAAQWSLPIDLFRAALEASVARAFRDRAASASEVERHAASLHLEDLALACACSG